LAITAVHKRSGQGHSRRAAKLAPALLCALTALCLSASSSLATSAGGTAASGATGPAASTGATKPSGKSTTTSGKHVTSVRITSVHCVPEAKCSGNPHQVSTHGTLLIAGKGIGSGTTIGFPAKPGGQIVRSSPVSHLRKTLAGLIVTVPAKAHSGHIMVLLSGSRHSSSYGPIYVYTHALHPPKPVATPAPAAVGAVSGSPFESQGMWIWYVSKSSGGSVPAIVAQAHAANVTTVFVKSSDGSSNYWSQFSPQFVAELHANGLKVCAWQYVYGTNPEGEANLGAEAVANGADCLVIDAEAEYEGHYAAAQTYIDDLRAKIGTAYPLGLASFPYVSYHPSFPYSVFLGPNGAQYNAPQMYWKDIGTSVDTVYANTFIANRIYGRPIFPLGQTYGGVSATELLRFREEAVDYGSTGLSFWDWQETPATAWSALLAPLAPLSSVVPNTSYPELHSGSKGDQVLWLQEHLATAVPSQEVTGVFGSQTTTNLKNFQTEHALTVTGVAEAATWAALLALTPAPVDWTGGGPSA
jgi:peptidoglycan hydrolase-like protein with peptidoglycan-binding domain